jgi:nuclear protein localization family protein 4
MSEIIVRISGPNGIARITANLNWTFQQLFEEISKKTNIEIANMRLSLNKTSYVSYPPTLKLGSIPDMTDGVVIYVTSTVKTPSQPTQTQPPAQTPPPVISGPTSKCTHGPLGRCLNCIDTSKPKEQDKAKTNDGDRKNQTAEVQAPTGKCNHGPNGRCLNCIDNDKKIDENEEKYITKNVSKNCTHGPKGRCLNCMSTDSKDIKHLSFDEFVDQNFAKCRSHSTSAKCQNCLVDLAVDYKIKMDCKNHEPYPRGMCSQCIPPSINVKRQIYRHVDYAQFMNYNEISEFIKYWLENINQRSAFLYGYYAEDPVYTKGVRAIIEALYEPPQENDYNRTIFLEDPFKHHVEHLAMALGLERVGWVFTTFNKDVFLSSEEMIEAAKLQEEFHIHHPIGMDVSKQITVVLRGQVKS